MKLLGGISLNGDGMTSSLNAMILGQEVVGVLKDNIAGYNKVGYQRKVPVVTSFAEFLGPHALSVNKDEQVGRIKITKKPLDLVLGNEGYFQVQTDNGIKLTRDGRFKLDKDGNLLTIQDHRVLSKNGHPIKLKKLPKNLNDIKIHDNGLIQYKDPENLKIHDAGFISAVSSDGSRVKNPKMKQGYLEESNVVLNEEIHSAITLRRGFTVNVETFKIQNDSLSKTIQQLGRA